MILAAAATVVAYAATDRLWFQNGTVSMGLDVTALDSLSLTNNGQTLTVTTLKNGTFDFDRSVVNTAKASAGDDVTEVLINYDGNTATVKNPYAFEGVNVTVDGADVTVNATVASSKNEVVYHLTGATTTGSFKIYSDYKLEVLLENVSITNDNGAAINVQTSKKTTVRVPDGTESTLCDSKKYSTPSGEDEKGTMFSEGQFEFRGKGTLNITGTKKHAICSDDYVQIKNTKINVVSSASDGIHANDSISIESGSLTMNNLSGDGIDADDEGCIKVYGGTLNITVSADGSKGLKASGGVVAISGGDITLNMTGNTVLKNSEPNYCTGIKSGKDFTLNGGNVTIKSTGVAGKGISVDANAYFNGGNVDIEVAGTGSTYTTTSSTTDSYSAACIKVDGNMNLLDGTYTLNTTSAAVGGKCINVDGQLTIGGEGHNPSVTATTRGARFLVSTSSSGTGGGRPGGGNFGGDNNDNSDYCNPKVIKAEGNLTVNSGELKLESTNTSTEGGECLESKSVLTVNGGTIEAIAAHDDGLNASTGITITGGNLYCVSSYGDAIDSNGTILISGGLILAMGSASPEAGIDCDSNSRFTLTGGTLVSLAGTNNSPGGSGTTQRVIERTGSVNTTTDYTFVDSSGNFLLNFRSPKAYTGNSSLMISTPSFTAKGQTVKLYTGATITGGTTFNGVTTGATFSGGTVNRTTFTTK
jgi:hypothetical protein